MKKYVKPELFYEHYELSQHIADCAWEWVNSEDENNCKAQADANLLNRNDFMFTAELSCDVIPGDNYEKYCYHGGSAIANVFNS